MRRLALLTVIVIVGRGCSGSHSRSAPSPPMTTTVPSSPEQLAAALTKRMVGAAILPPRSRRTGPITSAMLRGPWETVGGGNVVTAKRAWLVPGRPDDVSAFLDEHLPRGFDGRGSHGTSSSRTELVEYVIDELRRLPADVFAADLQIGVEARGAESRVNVVAVAQWSPRRPTDEFVTTRDRVAVVTRSGTGPPAAIPRRVVLTEPGETRWLVPSTS